MLRPLLLAMLSLMPLSQAPAPQADAFESEIWNAWNVTPVTPAPANWPLGLHSSVPTTFLIYSNGRTFGGKAIVDTYPGYGDLRDGRIDGENVSFTVIAHALVNFQSVDMTIYYTGKIHGDEMDLIMSWPMNYGPDRHPVLELNMKAKKFRHD
jgi:hypothetical protein